MTKFEMPKLGPDGRYPSGLTPAQVKEFMRHMPRRKRPPEPVLTVPISAKMAERIKANPEGVAVVHKQSPDSVPMFERPALAQGQMRVRIDLVREVDGQGRPVWDRPGVVSVYDPFSPERMGG